MNNYFRAYQRLTNESFNVAKKIIKYQRGSTFFSVFPLLTTSIIFIIGIVQLTAFYLSFFSENMKTLLAILILVFSFLTILVDFYPKKKEYDPAILMLNQKLHDFQKLHRHLSVEKKNFKFSQFYDEIDLIKQQMTESEVKLLKFPFSYCMNRKLNKNSDYYWIFLCAQSAEEHERKITQETLAQQQ
ncbi:hypothetical protein [Paenibacillus odorifer]|uniref:hypothetical protein n=1 Tax=Paenibacillus odorifer TaxID=189426 RepID=UPI00097008FD|nr:hypothetical protein [Paenibacillus odorifer]OME19933.1 hypothetical protein BSK57_23480 [Paenibacillus odorifer]